MNTSNIFKSTTMAVAALGLSMGVVSLVSGLEIKPGPSLTEGKGKWMAGDLHTHTVQSDDSRSTQTLDYLLDKALDVYKLDWMILSNHLRSSKFDKDGNLLAKPVPFAYAMESIEIPHVKDLQAGGLYEDKMIISGAEWDMPTHDHVNVVMFQHESSIDTATDGAKEFQYLFTTMPESLFNPIDVAAWKNRNGAIRPNQTGKDALAAFSWLKAHYPTTSFATINHPSRNPNKYTIKDLRQMNDLAPEIAFMIEGMVGNQMEPNRGGYESSYIDANLPNRTYGGVDAIVAKVGGMWDALLGEGRHVWNIADSDSHFKIDTASNSSGYYPGEYAKTYVWMPDSHQGTATGLISSLREGRMFGVFGDLINALDFRIVGSSGTAFMGQEIKVGAGEKIKLSIRFKSPDRNNYLKPVDGNTLANMKPVVNHVDLIVGDVSAKASPDSAAYTVATNPTTRVLKRFTAADWKVGKDGFASVTIQLVASKNQYYRLRGTNLAVDTPGLSFNGEPLADQKTWVLNNQGGVDNNGRVNAINDRNYSSLWFYSNPVFVSVN